MKRARQTLGPVGSPNSLPAEMGDGSSLSESSLHSKRNRQQHPLAHERADNGNSSVIGDDLLSGELGTFRALLAAHGVVWRARRSTANDSSSRQLAGFPCGCNPSKLRQGVERALLHDTARRVEFVEGMREFLGGPVETLRRALLPLDCEDQGSGVGSAVLAAAGRNAGGGGGVNAIHESLVKVLLRVDCIQPEVINTLLEKLPEIVAEGEAAGDGGGQGGTAGAAAAGAQGGMATSNVSFSQDLPRLVLNQVRFLDHLVDSTALTNKMLECMTVLPLDLQREMISYLPEVVEDGDHACVVETLQSLRESEPSLLVAVLDTLGNLSLPPFLLGDITADALGLLESAEPATLPVLVRFLLETATPDSAEKVVREVREKLRLSPAGGNGHGGGGGMEETEETEAPWFDSSGGDSETSSSGDALTLEALRQGLRLRGDLAASFLKAITKTDGSERHSVVDVWVLFCLHANQDTRKKVIALFRRKISLGHFTEALMADALHGRAGALHGLFQSLLGITDALVSAGALATRRFGATMYRIMFWEFSELYHRQEVVGALLTHAGAGSEAETDCSLSALSALAAASADSSGRRGLQPFAAFIRGLLDYLQGLTHNQVRQVFRILCLMASPVEGSGNEDSEGAADLDDVHIFIRKHVAMSQMVLKRIGIMGAVAMVEFYGKNGGASLGAGGAADSGMLSQDSTAGFAADSSSFTGSAGADILTMLLHHCRSSQEGKAFLYDELAISAGAGALSGHALDALVDMLSDPLENDFMNVLDGEEGEDEHGNRIEKLPTEQANLEAGRFSGELCGGAVKSRPFGDLDEQAGQVTEVLLLPLLASEDQQNRMKVGSLCPLFSLLSTCYRSPLSEGGMDSIDATLGASMILADSHTVDNIGQLEEGHKECVIGAHFAACDWMRELINAFVLVPDRYTKSKLVRRVGHLCRLEIDLLYMLKRCPGYRIYGQGKGGGGDITSSIRASIRPAPRDGAKGGKPSAGGKSKGKGKAQASSARPKKANKTEGEMTEAVRDVLRGAMRPLSPEAVLVLGFPGMLIKTRNTQGETLCVESIKVGLRGVHLLLQEMHRHLKRGLAPAKNTNPAFARLREAQGSSSTGGNGGASARPPRPALELLAMYQNGGVFRSLRGLLEMVGNSLRGVEEELGVISSDVDDEDMILPCLDITLKIASVLCGSDEVLGSGAGRALLGRCLADAFDGEADGDDGGESIDASDQRRRRHRRQDEEDRPFHACFDKLEDFASTVQQLPLAVQLVQVMEKVATARVKVLAARSPGDQQRRAGVMRGGDGASQSPHEKLSTLCLALLQRDWSEGDLKFVYKSSTLGVLVRAHLRWARDPLEAVEVMSSEVLPLLLETGESVGPAEGYPTLTAVSFSHFFTPLLQALVSCWKDRTDFFARPRVPTDALLMRTHRMVLVFRLVVMFTKGNPTLSRRPVLVSVLKEGKKVLQAFLRSISVLEAAFDANQDEVILIFKDLQQATRHMQSLCAHGKDLGDASMTKEAPVVKKLLEELIFRVRSLVQTNDCLAAMSVGNLKNRGLDGELLVTVPDEDEEEAGQAQPRSGDDTDGDTGSESESSDRDDQEQQEDDQEEDEGDDCDEDE